jgi:hypothetical protein
MIRLKPIDRPHLRIRRCALEPCRTAPAVLVGYGNDSMFDGILMNVIQAGKVALLIRKQGFAKIEPHTPSKSPVQFINPRTGFLMKLSKERAQAFRIISTLRRLRNKVVVIGKNRPSFQSPAMETRVFQEPLVESVKSGISSKEVFLLIRSCRDNVSARIAEFVDGCVRPIVAGVVRRRAHSEVNHTEISHEIKHEQPLGRISECGAMHRFPSQRGTTFESPFYDPRHPARHPSQSAVKRRTPNGQHHDQDSKPLGRISECGALHRFPSRRGTTFERPFYDPRHPAHHPSQSAAKRRTPNGQHHDQGSKPLGRISECGALHRFPSRRGTTFERPFYDPRHPARHPSQSAVERRTPNGQHCDLRLLYNFQ